MPSAGRTIADRRKRVRLAWVGEEAPVPLIDEAEERHLASATVSAGPWMSVPEVGERLGLSAWSVRRFIEAGDLGARTGSTPWRVSRGALDQYLRHARIQPGELAAILACTAPPAVEPNAYETIVNLQALLHWSLADIAAYCGIRAETVQHWRRRGVPERHQAALAARIAAAEAEAQEVDEVRPTPI
jgi:excisionase family DNA binding protein